MKWDYEWLMMGMGKLIRQYERGLVVKSEFDDEMWIIIMLHRDSMALEKEDGMSYGG